MSEVSNYRRRHWLRDHSTEIVWTMSLLLAGVGLVLAWWLIEPPCPATVEIATGSPQGQYHAVASQISEILAKDGITLIVRETKGSVENADLLRDSDSGVQLAIMQAGAVSVAENESEIESLAGLYFEPLWVFCRAEAFKSGELSQLDELQGKRIAIGAPGSGTRALAKLLLHENKIDDEINTETKLVDLSGEAAAAALRGDEVDAAVFVISPDSALIDDLLHDPDVRLLSFRRAEAYSRRFRFLTPVTLHEGVIDLEENVPDRDIQLIAPTACLVASEDLHHALVPLLLEAAAQVQQHGGILETPGDFPSPHHVDFRLNENARRYFAHGPSWLFRYLPFRWAAWCDRVKIMVLPLLTLLIPVIQFAPPLYQWSIRSRIYRWYGILREMDQKMRDGQTDFSAEVRTLENVELELAVVKVPLSYMDEFYTLREHVYFVLEQLRAKDQTSIPASETNHGGHGEKGKED